MTDKLEIVNPKDLELKKQLEAVKWPIEWGNIRLQLRAGKPTLLVIERTIRLDQ